MAEAFARAYGGDVLEAESAGLFASRCVPPDTLRAMAEKNLDLSGHYPKALKDDPGLSYDLAINMTGGPLPAIKGIQVRNWAVPDPVAMDYKNHCAVRDQIERLVMQLILELRRNADPRLHPRA
jgi:protein-tyrosine-phosphatase